VVRLGWRVGVPRAGRWRERLNTDSQHYGGSNVGTALGGADTESVACNDKADSIVIDLPPLATVMFEWAP
jgi:1,4-alpha-glucan branching enzyme